MKVFRGWGILFVCLVATVGCSQDSKLVSKANGPHQLMARWSLKVHGLMGGASSDYQIQVWENGEVFRAHVNSTVPTPEGPSREECDILCDGKTLWQFNRKNLDGGEETPEPGQRFEPADTQLLNSFYFWRVPNIPYKIDGTEKVLGRECTRMTASLQDITRNNNDVSCWVDPSLGYLLKRANKSGGEIYGGQSECLEVQTSPSFPAGHFDPPSEPLEEVKNPPQLWGSGILI